ncbi:MAG: hypothetical protein EXR99_06595 [Gemmataceae bacterium]|nr:hypothetical protein [Gemmataceae bacterium]
MRPTVFACAVLLLIAGCWDSGPRRHAISGQVLYQGKPLDQGVILFEPENPFTTSGGGAAIKDGRFAIVQEQGLMPGKYKVMISSGIDAAESKKLKQNQGPGEDDLPPKERIPLKYNLESKLLLEVGPDFKPTVEFDLK